MVLNISKNKHLIESYCSLYIHLKKTSHPYKVLIYINPLNQIGFEILKLLLFLSSSY